MPEDSMYDEVLILVCVEVSVGVEKLRRVVSSLCVLILVCVEVSVGVEELSNTDLYCIAS